MSRAQCSDRIARSERSLAYQEQISGLPRGFEIKLNGVRFDGCREADGTMLEAKGPGYADKMDNPDEWKDWYAGVEPIKAQMRRQSDAAANRKVEWHFAEPEPAAYFLTMQLRRVFQIFMFFTLQ
jgi:filamentous hemagglutinin